MKTTNKTIELKDRRVILSTLWIFVTLNYIYCDVAGLMDPELLRQFLTGNVNGIHMTQGFLLGAGILLEIPIAMVLLSRVLKYRANRWANIAAGSVMTAVQFSSLVLTPPAGYYVFFSIIEIGCTTLIVWYGWKWPHPEGGMLTSAGSGLFHALQREKQEAKRQGRTGSEDAHVAGYVGDTKPIK
jgi:MFS family permease